jgi:uncharacterized membrane protein
MSISLMLIAMEGLAESKRERAWMWAWLALAVLGGALRFAVLGAKTLWLDEAFSWWMARHDLSSLIAWIIYIDHHPPLYYLLLHGWMAWFGDGPSALRSLSALTSTLAIPFYAVAAHKLAGARVATVAALLLVISPFHLRYAQEARMYGVLTLAVALLLFALAYLLTMQNGVRRRHWWVLLTVAEAAAMLTHNTATVLIPLALNVAIGGLWLAQRHGWVAEAWSGLAQPHFWRVWILSQVGALLLWSPWALAFVHQAQVVDGDFWIAPPDMWTVWLALGSLTFAYLPQWLPGRDYWTWLGVALVLWGIWQWRRQPALTWVLLVLWLMPPLVELLASLRRPIFYDRTLIWTSLPYFILIARGIVLPGRLSGEMRRRWQNVWLLFSLTLMSVFCMLGLWNYYTTFEKEDWDKVALFVATEAQPQELILFHASWAEIPFDYYYAVSAPPLVHHGVPADLFDAGALEPPMREADVAHLQELIKGHDQVWLIYSHWWYTDPNRLLLKTLDEQFEVVEEREWPGIRVIQYERK